MNTVYKFSNRLANEKSPYLLQHAHNPVDWFPWCDEAFETAGKEDKPVFLSIGYSTCHWCHVMEMESFEDEETAKLLNETFINIKVDREERPDIDSVYMQVCQLLNGSGGWPLTIIMTPGKEPFFAGTYLPKESKWGRMGLIELAKRIKILWNDKREMILDSANDIVAKLKNYEIQSGISDINNEIFLEAYNYLSFNYDKINGGFSNAPKFPTPHNIFFLLKYWKRNKDTNALMMVENTMKKMNMGGIYDHVGFGFHRYSTDEKWLVPHFEKMLYDQALLAMAYTEAYQATKNEDYKKIAYEIFDYVNRDMTSPEGGFYSAEDADSEGVEGKYYLWEKNEIEKIVENPLLFNKIFNVADEGNFTSQFEENAGENILHLTKPISEIATEFGVTEFELKQFIQLSIQKLYDIRNLRIHPFKDDKILTDWNGLMIAAFAKAAQAFSDQSLLKKADNAFSFINKNMSSSKDGLLHRYRSGSSDIPAFLDDYQFLIWGLLELYEASFNFDYLKKAIELTIASIEKYYDYENGGFYFISIESEKFILRKKEIYDGAIPSGNSVAMMNLLKLSRMTGNVKFENIANQTIKYFSNVINSAPAGYTYFLTSFDYAFSASTEIIIVGDKDNPETQKMLQYAQQIYCPSKIILYRSNINEENINSVIPIIENYNMINGKTTAYVCNNFFCKQPVNNFEDFVEILENL